MYLDLKIGIFRKIIGMGTGEMGQHLRAPAVSPVDPGSIPNTQLVANTVGNYSPRTLDNAHTWFIEIHAIKIFTYI